MHFPIILLGALLAVRTHAVRTQTVTQSVTQTVTKTTHLPASTVVQTVTTTKHLPPSTVTQTSIKTTQLPPTTVTQTSIKTTQLPPSTVTTTSRTTKTQLQTTTSVSISTTTDLSTSTTTVLLTTTNVITTCSANQTAVPPSSVQPSASPTPSRTPPPPCETYYLLIQGPGTPLDGQWLSQQDTPAVGTGGESTIASEMPQEIDGSLYSIDPANGWLVHNGGDLVIDEDNSNSDGAAAAFIYGPGVDDEYDTPITCSLAPDFSHLVCGAPPQFGTAYTGFEYCPDYDVPVMGTSVGENCTALTLVPVCPPAPN